jgi:acyl-CoA synthetase (AMP-forming)/AMP-acid ligase II
VAAGSRPGTLEWLADQRPEEAVLLTPDGAVTRSVWEARAEALAEHLACERDVLPGDLLSTSGRIGPDFFVVSWAAAKLGAGLAGLPPGPGAGVPGATHVEALPEVTGGALPEGVGEASRRLSGAGAPPDSVTFSRLGRAVRRSFTPGAVAAIGVSVADLVARVRAVPGTTLVLAGPVSDTLLTFMANVVLVGGGRVVTAPDPAAALAPAAGHSADIAALPPAGLDELAELPGAVRDGLDLTSLRVLVTGGAALSAAARKAADDLFGSETIVDVFATADTGAVAVRGPGDEHHVLLDGVRARTTPGGLLEVRSPLAAAAGWVATGDRAALVGATGLELL